MTLEAVWRLVWPQFEEWCKRNGHGLDPIRRTASLLADMCRYGSCTETENALGAAADETANILPLLTQFQSENDDKPCLQYWMNYMAMVTILLNFMYAERRRDWKLHLTSVTDMLPYFTVFDHANYFKWGMVYVAEMRQLEQTAPAVYQECILGNVVVKSTNNKFNQLPVDQALEHVNKIGKIAGGIVGITRTDMALAQWALTYNERSRISDDTRTMFGIMDTEDE